MKEDLRNVYGAVRCAVNGQRVEVGAGLRVHAGGDMSGAAGGDMTKEKCRQGCRDSLNRQTLY